MSQPSNRPRFQTPVAIALLGSGWVGLRVAPAHSASVSPDDLNQMELATLDFSLTEVKTAPTPGETPSAATVLSPPSVAATSPPPDLPELSRTNRLPIPAHAKSPPIATGESRTFATVPPPPEIPINAGIVARAPHASQPSAPEPQPDPVRPSLPPADPDRAAIASSPVADLPKLDVDFAIPPAPAIAPLISASPRSTPPKQLVAAAPSRSLEATAFRLNRQQRTSWMFAGGSHSLVARAIGHAEGTRTADGGYTQAYNGHRDPGNGKHNLGTFSYQHGAASPEEADRRQLARLQGQHQTLLAKAQAHRLNPTLAEELNALDLANQSPRAALSPMGYMDRLAQAHQMGLRGHEALLWARTRSFLDPDTGRWNASGLGNDGDRITRDQERRIRAIAAVLRSENVPIPIAPVAGLAPDAAPTPVVVRTETQTPPPLAVGIEVADAATSPLFTAALMSPSAAAPSGKQAEADLPNFSRSPASAGTISHPHRSGSAVNPAPSPAPSTERPPARAVASATADQLLAVQRTEPVVATAAIDPPEIPYFARTAVYSAIAFGKGQDRPRADSPIGTAAIQ